MSDNTALRVMRARLEDVQPLAAAFRREVGGEGMVAEAPLPTGAVFWQAARGDAGAVGYAAGTLRPEGVVLGPVYVRPEHRRRGIGLMLLREVERWAEGARIPVVEVSVAVGNPAGVRFLEAAGYSARRILMARATSGEDVAR